MSISNQPLDFFGKPLVPGTQVAVVVCTELEEGTLIEIKGTTRPKAKVSLARGRTWNIKLGERRSRRGKLEPDWRSPRIIQLPME